MRYWRFGPASLGTSPDDVDLSGEPGAEELTQIEWETASDEIQAATSPSGPTITPLTGDALSHVTSASARKVTIYVISPTGGPTADRPTVDGQPIAGLPGGMPYIFESPGSLTIATNDAGNDLVVVEE
jgi:hypothetical protein